MFENQIFQVQSIKLPKKSLIMGGLVVSGFFFVVLGLWLLVGGSNQVQADAPVQSAQSVDSSSDEPDMTEQIIVDVAGAVENPGTYSLDKGSRLSSAIEKAGGFSQMASTDYISAELNLAKVLGDEDKIYILTRQEYEQMRTSENTGITASGADEKTATSKISINNSTLDELQTLKGVGEKRALDIIDGRPYTSLTEVVSRKILSQKIFDDNSDLLKL